MNAKKSVAQRLGRVLEAVTRQSGRLPETPEYGSWLLGKVSESQLRRRVRIQVILTVIIVSANLVGVGVVMLLVTVALPVPDVFAPEARWITFGVSPAYIAMALLVGAYWITRRTVTALRWAIEERAPTRTDQRNTFVAPWRVAVINLVLWGVGAVLFAILYGLVNTQFVPKILFSVSFSGIVVSASCYLFTEFALRPVAAQALEAGRPPRRFAPGVMGRIMAVWLLGSGVAVGGIMVAAVFGLSLPD